MFMEPEGIQSVPRPMGMPSVSNRVTGVVSPYREMLVRGDQMSFMPRWAMR